MNLIRTKCHKVIYGDSVVGQTRSSTLSILLDILKTCDTKSWTDDQEHLYTNIYKLYEDKNYKDQYDKLQENICYNKYDGIYYDYDYDDSYSYDDIYSCDRQAYRYGRYYCWDW